MATLLGKILAVCSAMPDLNKHVAALIPKILDMCIALGSNGQVILSVLVCVQSCAINYPNACGAYKNKLEGLLVFKCVDWHVPREVVQEAGKTLHYLQQVLFYILLKLVPTFYVHEDALYYTVFHIYCTNTAVFIVRPYFYYCKKIVHANYINTYRYIYIITFSFFFETYCTLYYSIYCGIGNKRALRIVRMKLFTYCYLNSSKSTEKLTTSTYCKHIKVL